jgi:transposase
MLLRVVRRDSLTKISPTHTLSVNRNLTAVRADRPIPQANAGVVPPRLYKRGNYIMKSRFYGIDVSKDTLDIGCDGKAVQIQNSKTTIRAFTKTMPSGSYVAMEATNTYHLAAADVCHCAGMRVYVVNPRITRHYREVMSLRGHNDRMDALAIAGFIEREHEHLREYTPKTPDERRLQTLIRRRSKLVSVKTQVRQSMSGIKEIKGELDGLVKRIERMISKIELLIDQQLEGNEDRSRLNGIKAVGPVVSAALLSDLQCGHFKSGDAFVAFEGLDPRPNDSGRKRGKRKLSKQGTRVGRTLLYNAAMSATNTKIWRPIYEAYLERGLSKIQAIVAIARKIARVAWSIYTYKTDFDPARLQRA